MIRVLRPGPLLLLVGLSLAHCHARLPSPHPFISSAHLQLPCLYLCRLLCSRNFRPSSRRPHLFPASKTAAGTSALRCTCSFPGKRYILPYLPCLKGSRGVSGQPTLPADLRAWPRPLPPPRACMAAHTWKQGMEGMAAGKRGLIDWYH